MCWRRAATSADDVHSEIADEVRQFFRQRLGRLFEDGVTANVFRDAGIGND